MSARNGAAPATDGAVKQGPTIVVAGERDKQLLSDQTWEVQGRKYRLKRPPKLTDDQKLRLKRGRYWAIMAFEEAGARWMPSDARGFIDREPVPFACANLADLAQYRAEKNIERLRALRVAFVERPHLLEAAE